MKRIGQSSRRGLNGEKPSIFSGSVAFLYPPRLCVFVPMGDESKRRERIEEQFSDDPQFEGIAEGPEYAVAELFVGPGNADITSELIKSDEWNFGNSRSVDLDEPGVIAIEVLADKTST